ncbi:MAG: hypothetical protein CVT94_03590 [Bacteroidetes bacterium HGW-Bacteroidetes-11]|jgi:ATP-dependent exoDNAse (exonuclease V) beta subunit|nr:MAG: hypothetical protein CVT94_03590 [Bacteroidetes bacterium HGW-Bacteroidetes-11]
MNNFLVYKSSAGSGKTYTLMLIYLTIILKEPARYRNILAITFTNKAANEIKQRIVASLKLVAEIDESNIPAKHSHLITALIKGTGLEFKEIRKNANQALTLILHNYSDFAVSTIDSFVHKVIRAFAFDLKLSMSFEVEMDSQLLLSLAVEDMLAAAGSDNELTEILVNFIQQKAEEDESWQIDRLLVDFAKNLFKEDAIPYLPLIQSMNALKISETSQAISKFVKNYENTLISLGKEAINLINQQGLDENIFIGKSKGIYGFFNNYSLGIKLKASPSPTVVKNVEADSWLSPDGKKSPLRDNLLSITAQLTDIFRKIEHYNVLHNERATILEMVRQQLYPMSVLSEVKNRLDLIKKERNILPIAEFNRIVGTIVSEEPVPFIYERIGEKFRHYMIDEFQDTSVLQWLNLMPLIENSLSLGGVNMIVGDGKQAIYRFRNGDVDQFVRLPDVNNPGLNHIIEQRAQALQRDFKAENLNSNFRSRLEVVDFNNRFFSFVAPVYLIEKQVVYEKVEQIFDPKNSGGMVQVELHDEESGTVAESHIARVLELVISLCDEGYKPGDIAILCRANHESSQIAVNLYEHGIKVVSSDSLLLKNSHEVVFLTSWFALLNNANDEISRVTITDYLIDNQIIKTDSKASLFNEVKSTKTFYDILKEFVPEFSVSKLRDKSLFDLTEELIRVFGLHLRSPLYVQFFLDEVLKFSSSGQGGIAGFIDYWDSQSDKLSVVMSESSDAVKVMTIHKSKGLEFPVVIYPFAKQQISNRPSQVWAPLDDDTVPELKLAYLKLTKELEGTRYNYLYEEERDKKKLDLLNMVYVAFTRAAERLYILSGAPKKKPGDIASVTDMLVEFLTETGKYEAGKLVYSFGESPVIKGHNNSEELAKIPVKFQTWPWHERLIFASRAPQHWQASAPKTTQISGNILHMALSGIITPENVEKSTAGLINAGLITSVDAPEIIQKLHNLLEHPGVKPFFTSDAKVINEAEILTNGGKSYRPDRVLLHSSHTDVIDYKAGKPMEYHKDQVQHYAGLLSKMGYPEVKSWLVYLEDPFEVIEV